MRNCVTKRKVFVLLVGVFAILLYFIYYFLNQQIQPEGAKLTEEQLIHDIKVIQNDQYKTKSIRIFKNDTDYNLKNQEDLIKREERVIYVSITNKLFGVVNQPFEVRAAIRTWLYILKRSQPFTIVGVEGDYLRRYGMFPHHSALISKTEFLSLYNEVKTENINLNKDSEQLVNLLSERWIEKYSYNKWWKQVKD